MATIPFALSVHHFISSVGADVGFASIIGLAILVLLYFAQARETANLREQAYEAAQRVSQLEGRLSTLARQQQAAPAPQPPATVARPGTPAAAPGTRTAVPAAAPALAGAVAVAPGPPAGVAAPALTAATKLIPTTPVVPQPPAPEVPDQPLDLTTLGLPVPETAAGSNGASKGGVAAAPPRVAPSPRGPQQPQRPVRGPQPPRARQAGPPPRGSAPAPRKSRAGLRFALLIGALAIAGVVVALVVLTSSGGNPASNNASATSNAPQTTHPNRAAAVDPAAVTVTVLNGTATAGLADRIATKLTGAGFKQGTVANASDQTRTATTVAYMPGRKRDALAVARSLKLGPASVQPLDASTRAVACPSSGTCSAQVVVTVGTDLTA
jgi:LytR cell envelope-related transcriptional attenuator